MSFAKPGWKGLDRDTKFGNTPMRCRQGVMHHSKIESLRCDELHLMVAGGLIEALEAHPQPRFDLSVNGVHVCFYFPDFAYTDAETGQRVVEDVKGGSMRTKEYVLKARLMLAIHGVEIQEVTKVRGRR